MKLDYDCMRTILFEIERSTSFERDFEFDISNVQEALSDFSPDKIQYHIRQMHWSGLCTKPTFHSDGCFLKDLTPEGHKFLSDVRSDTNWNKTKQIAEKAGIFTIDSLKTIAIGVATASIQKYLP
ncbi:DUF2513 domain-containing protein [Facklamia hominis]|uniref:DUF2513 domain-containing protein n=1 Tax=Facklamia hominis TaxID=178214 RepID=A0AAJ1Q7D3_9LACT|nr:DUF2513 domain-containing protein [Facklamia hominis]MDK7187962.1 DUF2513 domain-containing protein [Facklamia hominis]